MNQNILRQQITATPVMEVITKKGDLIVVFPDNTENEIFVEGGVAIFTEVSQLVWKKSINNLYFLKDGRAWWVLGEYYPKTGRSLSERLVRDQASFAYRMIEAIEAIGE